MGFTIVRSDDRVELRVQRGTFVDRHTLPFAVYDDDPAAVRRELARLLLQYQPVVTAEQLDDAARPGLRARLGLLHPDDADARAVRDWLKALPAARAALVAAGADPDAEMTNPPIPAPTPRPA